MSEGSVILVGAGPGNPELLTLKAQRMLLGADVVIYDNLVNPSIVEICPDSCERIYVGKKAGVHAIDQSEIENILVTHARKGKRVVRLKGGDPFVFGRGGEEVSRLSREGIRFEIVPGVTAALAAAAYSGIPLTHRDHSSSVAFLTGHEILEKEEFRVDFGKFAQVGGTLCIYMGMGKLEKIVKNLTANGLSPSTPVCVIRWASLSRQKSVQGTLETICELVREAHLVAPAVIIVGLVAGIDNEAQWFEKLPLFGRRIVITRSGEQSAELEHCLRDLGAEVLKIPLIEIKREINPDAAREILDELGNYDWMIFTSANGVRHFFTTFFSTFKDLRSLGFLRIAAIGQATAREIEKYHLSVDCIPAQATVENLVESMSEQTYLDHLKILVIQGNRNREVLVRKLEAERAIIDTFQVYGTHFTNLEEHAVALDFRQQGADAIIFASSSAAQSFLKQAGQLSLEQGARRPKSCSIGEKTSETMRKLGIPVDIQAGEPSLEGISKSLISFFSKKD